MAVKITRAPLSKPLSNLPWRYRNRHRVSLGDQFGNEDGGRGGSTHSRPHTIHYLLASCLFFCANSAQTIALKVSIYLPQDGIPHPPFAKDQAHTFSAIYRSCLCLLGDGRAVTYDEYVLALPSPTSGAE